MMNEFFIPVELLIIGASMRLKKKKVTSKEVAEYRKLCPYPLEYDSENTLHYCTYDEKNDTYTIKDNLKIHPYILKILTNISNRGII